MTKALPRSICVGGPHDGVFLDVFSNFLWVAKAMPATAEWPANQGDGIRIDKYVKKVSKHGVRWIWEPGLK